MPPTASDLGLDPASVTDPGTGPVTPPNEPTSTSQGSTSQLPEDEKSKASDLSDSVSVPSRPHDGLDVSDGYTGPKSMAHDEPVDGPSHNSEGYRNVVTDQSGNVTVLDDDTAHVLYDNPKFYTEIFHNGGAYPVSRLVWANAHGAPASVEPVGEAYARGQ